jgi:SAM-dependent methyltransferase
MPISARPRRRVPELMDRPDLPEREHLQALKALGRANAVSRTDAMLWPAIRALVTARGAGRPIRILDIASGGGHMSVALSRRAAREGIAVEICGCDISPRALAFAGSLAARKGARGVAFRRLDVIAGPLPEGFDVVCSSLFLHHLDEDEAMRLLGTMQAAAGQLLLVSDLDRSRIGRAIAWAGCRLLSASRVFHVDGPRSVDAAFTAGEAACLAARAGIEGVKVTRHWPRRWLLAWRRSA